MCPALPYPVCLTGNADLSGDMALRIEKAFGVRMDTLMRMQAAYNIAQTRKREKTIHVRRISQPANTHAHEETAAKLTIAPSCASTPLLRSIGHQ